MSGLTTQQIADFMEAMLKNKKVTVGDIVFLIKALVVLEQKIEDAIATEKNLARKKQLAAAFESKRDLVALRESLFVRKHKQLPA